MNSMRMAFVVAAVVLPFTGGGCLNGHPSASDRQTASTGKLAAETGSTKSDEYIGKGKPPPPKDLTIRHVAFSPDGKLLLAFDGPPNDENVYIWDVDKRQQLWSGRVKGLRTALFFPSSRRIAFGCYGGAIDIWDVQKLEKLFTLAMTMQHVGQLLITEDNRYLVGVGSGGYDGAEIKMWDLDVKAVEVSFLGVPDPKFRATTTHSAIWSVEGSKVLMINNDPSLDEIDLNEAKAVRLKTFPADVSISFSLDRKSLVVDNREDPKRSFYSLPDLKKLASDPNEKPMQKLDWSWPVPKDMYEKRIATTAFSPDSRLLAAGGGQLLRGISLNNVSIAPTLDLFDASSGKIVATLMAP
ncbi:MAG TPA: hypothetical protein VE988_24475 [Gemmataceae bacterium]|nr:hypothetical protein [Gemmataceae bacterium]